jgi:iron complex outermembrane receptor protein
VYPGIDLAFRPNEITRIYASANRAMRLPTFNDLYYEDPSNIGNPDLMPERSTEYEFGTILTANNWSARINYFYRHISDAIDWIWLDDQEKWHTVNHSNVYTHGISTGGQWNSNKDFFVQSISANYTFMNSEKSAGQYVSNYEMNYLRHRFTFGFTHRIFGKINAHWQVGWQDRNGFYMHFNSENNTFSETPWKPFWQIDLRILRQTERFNIFLEASNLGNKQHQDVGNVTLPGRWIRAGIAVTLRAKNAE